MDAPRRGFLEKQLEEGLAFAAESDVIDLLPVAGSPPDKYIATFRTAGLIRRADGEITEAEAFAAGITFAGDYLARVDPLQAISWLEPQNAWHPNIGRGHLKFGPQMICIGKIIPGTSLVNLLYRIHDVITYQKYTLVEWDALNFDACQWARGNIDRFPITTRPLKRRHGHDVSYRVSQIGGERG